MISLRPQSVDFQSSWEANCQAQLKSLFNQPGESDKPLSAIKLYSYGLLRCFNCLLLLNLCRNIYELCIAFPENHTMTLLKNIAQLFYNSAMEMRQVINDFLKISFNCS